METVLSISVLPLDLGEEPPPSMPMRMLSLDFDDGATAPALEPEWLERLAAADLRATEDEDTGCVTAVDALVPLQDVIVGGRVATEQAETAADWIEARLAVLGGTPPQ